jgi:hypothetical protein
LEGKIWARQEKIALTRNVSISTLSFDLFVLKRRDRRAEKHGTQFEVGITTFEGATRLRHPRLATAKAIERRTL